MTRFVLSGNGLIMYSVIIICIDLCIFLTLLPRLVNKAVCCVLRRWTVCSQKQIMDYFDQLDVARHGFLTTDQLLGPITHITGLDEPGARVFINTLDSNEDGLIDKHEFITMWSVMFE